MRTVRRSVAVGIDVGHRPSFCPTARRRADPMGSTSWPVAGGEAIRLHLRLRSTYLELLLRPSEAGAGQTHGRAGIHLVAARILSTPGRCVPGSNRCPWWVGALNTRWALVALRRLTPCKRGRLGHRLVVSGAPPWAEGARRGRPRDRCGIGKPRGGLPEAAEKHKFPSLPT